MSFAFKLGRLVMRVRPAPLAVALKRLLPLHRRIVNTAEGRFWADPASDAGQRIWHDGGYDPTASAMLRRLLRPGDTYIDIGANEGCLCVTAAQAVGSAGRTIAVEPQARLQEVLRRNLELNGLAAEILPVAVSDHAGTAELHLTPDVNNSASGLAAHTRYALATQTVPLVTLTGLFAQVRPAGRVFLKMDIEGFEHEAVLGSPELFRARRIALFMLELHPEFITRRGLDPGAVPAFLRDCGYRPHPEGQGLVWEAPDQP